MGNNQSLPNDIRMALCTLEQRARVAASVEVVVLALAVVPAPWSRVCASPSSSQASNW